MSVSPADSPALPAVAGAAGPHIADPLAAESDARLAIELDSSDAVAWFHLGASLHAQERIEEALEAFRKSIDRDSSAIAARHAAAVLLLALDRPAQALEHLDLAHAVSPDDALTLANTGAVLERLREPVAALDAYDRALRADPSFAPALFNRVSLLAQLSRLDEALRSAERFVEAYPGIADGHFNLAEVRLARGEFDAAVAACDACLTLAPEHARAHADRGLGLAMLRRYEEASAAMSCARRADPAIWTAHARLAADLATSREGATGRAPGQIPDPREVFLRNTLDRIERCDWTDYEATMRAIRDAARGSRGDGVDCRSLLFTCWATPVGDAVHRPVAARVASEIERRVPPRIWTGAVAPGTRLRVGYLSADVGDHPAGQALRALVRAHERERLEVRVYSLTPSDGGDVRRDIESWADAFIDLSGTDDGEAAWRIFSDGCDVLVDFAGYTRNARPEILAYRPAAVQVTHQGFHASLGGRFVDYHLTSASASPPGERDRWVEARCFLPGTAFVYDDETEISAAPVGRGEFGLDPGAVVYCCFNQPFKIDPESFGAWMRVLHAVPRSVLWLQIGDPGVERALRGEAQARGVDPGRLANASRTASHARHLARTRLADVYLDTFWFNGHTTLCDALWAGVPVVTRRGSTPYGRLGAGIVESAGMASLVAADTDEFVELAVRLGADAGVRAEAADTLRKRRGFGELFDTQWRTRALEAAFGEMVRRFRAGEAPADFAIDATTLSPRVV